MHETESTDTSRLGDIVALIGKRRRHQDRQKRPRLLGCVVCARHRPTLAAPGTVPGSFALPSLGSPFNCVSSHGGSLRRAGFASPPIDDLTAPRSRGLGSQAPDGDNCAIIFVHWIVSWQFRIVCRSIATRRSSSNSSTGRSMATPCPRIDHAAMWVPRSATADWPADDCIGISVLDCLQCDGTGTVRLDRDAAIVRRDPAGNSARAWVLRKTILNGLHHHYRDAGRHHHVEHAVITPTNYLMPSVHRK